MQPEKLKTWLKRQPERVTLFRIVYSGVDGGDEVLGEWLAEDHKSIESVGELASQIVDAAQAHCDELGCVARYRAVSYEGDSEGAKEVLGQVMRQRPNDLEDGEAKSVGNMEDASAAGITGQAIRHTEAMTRMLVTSIQQIMSVQQSQVDQLQRSVAMYQKREGEILDLARALATTTEDAVNKERNADRWDRFATVVTDKLGPAVMEHMGLLPEGAANGAATATATVVEKAAEAAG